MNAFIQNIPTILVGLAVFGLLFLVARKLYLDKKAGKNACSGCKGCSGSETAKHCAK